MFLLQLSQCTISISPNPGSYMYTLTGNKEEWEKAVSSGTTNIVSVKSRRIYLVWTAVIVECNIPLWQF